jgi:hypothetical protein
MKEKKIKLFIKKYWDFLIIPLLFVAWNFQWLSFPDRIVTLSEQNLISGLLKDFVQMILTAASLIIPLSVGIIAFIFTNKQKYSEIVTIIQHLYHATIILLVSVGVGIYNMSHIPFLVLRKSCNEQYYDIFTNEAVIILSLLQLCSFLLGLIKIMRGGHLIFKTHK